MTDISTADPSLDALKGSIEKARAALAAEQQPDGHFVFELEADATIPAEYILFHHYMGDEPDTALEAKFAVYLRRMQGEHGGWSLVHGGPFNISASVKAYFALKMIGEDIEAPHMQRARAAILAHGGAAASNVFCRCMLALYGAIPWRGVPVLPVEIMHLPFWFPFHINKVSYWARTVIVPLSVIAAIKPKARNPRGIGIPELFTVPPEKVRRWPKGPHQKAPWTQIFGGIDRLLRLAEPYMPKKSRQSAIRKAEAFLIERLNGEDGVGGIYPAMANTVMMFDALGYAPDDPRVLMARQSIEKLVVVNDTEAYCQPCLSPVWDTALTCHALLETGDEDSVKRALDGLAWLKPRQILDTVGDWSARRPDVPPGGWAFQYQNPHYPDLDDTAVVVMAMDRAAGRLPPGHDRYKPAIDRATTWVAGLQSTNGGYGAFDADNNYEYLNNIPFSDHGALLDPPTADVTARCISMFAQLGETAEKSPRLRKAIDCLLKEQMRDGSWYGRWGLNYVYGTWSALCALNAAGLDHRAEPIRRAVEWLTKIQNADGGWGEGAESYDLDYKAYRPAPSTASQTSWALLGLMAAGEARHAAVARGIQYLMKNQADHGTWDEKIYTATGFPRVFYLRYHGYRKFFPLWAMARYRNLMSSNAQTVLHGM